jgi:DNA primase
MNDVIDQIKEKIDIVEFIQSAGVQLKRAGRSYVGFCPFHSNTRSPAFNVFPDTQSYHCFGCKASGTVFDFVMQREGLEFRDALEQLARRAGVQLVERTQEDVQQDQLRTRLLEIHQAAAAFFHHVLVKSPRGEVARAYVQKRAINQETIESFLLGYAVDEWSALLSYLTDRKGFEPEEIEAAGLAIRRESGGYYDRFRGRVIFPIRNAKGEVIAFGGRAMGDAQPKYLNSPQTPLFDKSSVLYGLDLARDAIRSADAAVIVEGYVDVIIAHQHGFRNVVAPLGTALTTDHVDLIKRLTRHFYLALDADPAGVRAALKGAQTIQSQQDGDLVAVTGPHGVVGLQRSQSVEIRVIEMPDGKDPDEVIQADPEGWKQLVAQARPAMDFYLTALTTDLDLTSAHGKSEAVDRLAPLLAQITNPIEHAHYIQQVARLVHVDEASVMRALPRGQQPGGSQRPAGQGRPAAPAARPGPAERAVSEQNKQSGVYYSKDERLLCMLLLHPTTHAAVQEKLQRDLEAFPLVQKLLREKDLTDLFELTEHRMILAEWERQALGTDPKLWAQNLGEPLSTIAQHVLLQVPPSPQAYRYINEALECATILQRRQAQRWINFMKLRGGDPIPGDTDNTDTDYIVSLFEYVNMIMAPRRSSTFADLHKLHTS